MPYNPGRNHPTGQVVRERMAEELIGKMIGGYQVIDILGRGGMAVVYRAHQVSMNRDVALKVLPRQFLHDDTYLKRFSREVEIVSRLEHRSIVPVYDYGEHNGQPYIAMRLMSGGSVEDLLKHGPLPPDRVLDILAQVGPALDFAHSRDVLHRDLKPSNILLDSAGGAYITDFGIGRWLSEMNTTITTQGVVGTPSYMSPEQAQAKPLDGRSDLYSLGVMLFEMTTGQRPFESDTPYSIAVMQVTTQPPAPRSIKADVTPAVEAVILRTLEKSPADRYQTAAELVAALRTAQTQPTASDTPPRPGPVVPAPTPASIPSAAPVPPPLPHYTPPPGAAGGSQPYVEWLPSRRRANWLLSWVLGSVIGCALLSVVLGMSWVFVRDLFVEPPPGEAAVTEDAAATEIVNRPDRIITGSAPVTTDAPRSTATVLPATATEPVILMISVTPAASPVTGVAPIGVRPTNTRPPQLIPITATPPGGAAATTGLSGQLLFFAERDAAFNIYRLDLATLGETQITDVDGADSYPVVSPDGTRIVYQSSRDGDFDIYVADIDGGNGRKLTDNTVIDRLPDWSPDGEWIIYSSDTRGDGTLDLYRIRPDGTDLEQVFSNGLRNSHPRYSPDGRSIVFTTGDPDDSRTWEIARIEASTGVLSFLTRNNIKDWSPNFHPDGQRIVYLTDGDGHSAIATMALDGADVQPVFDGSGYELGASYSPDGEQIVFSSDVTGRDELYVMRADGSDVRQVTTGGGLYGHWVR